MKPSVFLTFTAAVVALAGCNSKTGDAPANTSVEIKQVAPPKGGDWSQMVTATPAGGFLMGNPNAKVKLVEYGSMTCPHCREFEETSTQPLIDKYVKSGQVSFEFRNYVRDGFDLAASLVARCNGEKGFFPLTRAMYKDQNVWVGKLQQTPQAQLEALSNLPPSQQFIEMAKAAGLQDWAAVRGVPVAKSNQCLSNEASINQLVEMAGDATQQYPEFPGTPAFTIDGTMVALQGGSPLWDQLQAALNKALGS